ncbi:hypothetical protein EIN_084010 [Entamoeba invadens IP1]|uniref:hypothetical protein n=1 Tax=Entamoeba invadens IP1 TaxID=370355 RepID=UPI0002C3EB3C|nr:hypothetical protein EIN_084010 [Entamoeba invadens IP1]ELP85249.1 hypothetical protein EIN_084010 [Entamoeba invadens IP1]|eukprot:XP_004184595.1 hypothetical protein EIN_084010 [Entamoeba invadens IP1]
MQLFEILSNLEETESSIKITLTQVIEASDQNNSSIYDFRMKKLKTLLDQFNRYLEIASRVPESLIEEDTNLNYSQKVTGYLGFVSRIEKKIPPRPTGDISGNAEELPLIQQNSTEQSETKVPKSGKDSYIQLNERLEENPFESAASNGARDISFDGEVVNTKSKKCLIYSLCGALSFTFCVLLVGIALILLIKYV